MEKEEALNIFIKRNISLLTSTNVTPKIVKRIRQDFYAKMNLKSDAIFSNRDVGEKLIREVSRLKKDGTKEEILHALLTIPLISEEVPRERIEGIITQNIAKGTSILTKEDLSKFGEEKYLESIEKRFEQKAMEKVQQELTEERQKLEQLIAEAEKEKEYLKKYISQLDELPPIIVFKEEELRIESKTGIPEVSWWKKIGLNGNPFPSDQGLIGIPKELYEKIVVRTRFVDSYLSRVENTPEDFLGQSVVVIGEFGSGKTTLLETICYKLGAKGILPCKVILTQSPDADALSNELLKQIGIQLGKLITRLSGINKIAEYGIVDSLSKLSWVLEDFKKYGGKGLVISVDGLHKGSKYFAHTLEFLQQLQNVHEFIEQSEVPCGFLLAGSLFWEKEIAGTPSLGGSVSKIDIIPPLTEVDACEAIARRIMSFSPSGARAPTIRKESIRIAYRTFSERSKKPLTFRSFMNHIRDRLIVGNYDEVGIGVSSHFEMIDTIKKYVEASEIGGQFKAIGREIIKAPGLGDVLCEILPKIYQLQGVEEKDVLFRSYINVFNLLKIQGFVVKRKSSRAGPFVWSISPSLARVLYNIRKDYSVSPDEALGAIFESSKKVISRETKTTYSSVISKLSESSTVFKDSWPEISTLLVETKCILMNLEDQIISGDATKVDPSLIAESCKVIVICVLKAGGKVNTNKVDSLDLLQDLWCVPENVDDIIELCKNNRGRFTTHSEVFGVLHHHSEIIGQLIDLLSDLIRGEGISRLIKRRLVSEDMRRIHKARILFINQSYKDAIDITCELLEEKARDIGFSVIKTLWGERYTNIIPADIAEKLPKVEMRGHPRARRSRDVNFFYDISRSEYGKILFQKQFRKIIFGENITDIVFSQMKDMWDLAFSLGDREAHRDRPNYFREHATEIADVIRVLPSICESFLVAIERLLHSLEFHYEKRGSAVVGKYTLEGSISYSCAKITIENKNVQRIMKTILSSLARNPREVIPLDRILIVEGEPPEAQIAIINAMIRRSLFNISPILHLELTDKGRSTLQDLTGETNQTHEC